MNILFNKHFFLGFMITESVRILAPSVFGYFPLYIFVLSYMLVL